MRADRPSTKCKRRNNRQAAVDEGTTEEDGVRATVCRRARYGARARRNASCATSIAFEPCGRSHSPAARKNAVAAVGGRRTRSDWSEEHYDDHAQAERETERLNQLIDESKKTIKRCKKRRRRQPTSYAVVPYEGPNGTYRRPIYIECVKDGVVLQPEGVHIPADDLRPPYGAGNPLASVIRATRDHIRALVSEGRCEAAIWSPTACCLVRSEGLVNVRPCAASDRSR